MIYQSLSIKINFNQNKKKLIRSWSIKEYFNIKSIFNSILIVIDRDRNDLDRIHSISNLSLSISNLGFIHYDNVFDWNIFLSLWIEGDGLYRRKRKRGAAAGLHRQARGEDHTQYLQEVSNQHLHFLRIKSFIPPWF